jgi:repressor LexA
MIGAGIHDGDVVVVRRQLCVEIGENAAAMIRNKMTGDLEAAVKLYRVYDGHVWLISRNPVYAPIPGDSAIIIGKVAAVFRGGLCDIPCHRTTAVVSGFLSQRQRLSVVARYQTT